MTRQTLRRRSILVSDEVWEQIEKAAADESKARGVHVPVNEFILDQLTAALFFINWDELPEEHH